MAGIFATMDTTDRLRPAVLLTGLLALAACGGEPPEAMAGFRLDMSQTQLMSAANARPGFTCRLQASRPKVTACSGPTDQGQAEAVVVGDSGDVRITLELARSTEDPARAIREFTKPFGSPAWRDRPYPPLVDPPEGYHTFWVSDDSTRGIALLCQHRELGPPCNARLTITSPAGVQAKLDTLMGIRR
jgi:hypothetical protein